MTWHQAVVGTLAQWRLRQRGHPLSDPDNALRLKACDISRCEAMCCHDGVHLDEGEERRLRALVEHTPALRARLPAEYVVDAWIEGEYAGRKTAVRAHDYRNPAWPAHFPRTRCVFADEAGMCELQKLGLARRQHPWRYKPFTCWMFPLGLDAETGAVEQPEVDAADDPSAGPGYPGFVSVMPCGRHDPQGEPWWQVLSGELARYAEVGGLPGHGSVASDDDAERDAALPGPADVPPFRP